MATTNLPLNKKLYADTLLVPAEKTNDEKRTLCENFIVFVYTVASIDTNVVLTIQVSFDGTNWGTVTTSATHIANGTFALTYTGAAPYVTLNFESETGGTAAIITVRGSYSR